MLRPPDTMHIQMLHKFSFILLTAAAASITLPYLKSYPYVQRTFGHYARSSQCCVCLL